VHDTLTAQRHSQRFELVRAGLGVREGNQV
jgi:hypothetical protein